MKKIVLLVVPAILVASLAYSSFSGMFSAKEANYSCSGCNVVLVSIDTLRADHLSSYGYFRKTSPNIDRLAAEGVLFENFFSNIPFTPPSHWSIMTSLYPARHRKYLPTDSGDGIETLAGVLRNNGYATAGFVSSFMVKNLSDGFEYYDIPEGIPAVAWARKKNTGNVSREEMMSRVRYRKAENTADKAIEWLRKNGKKKFFVFVHFFDAHSPYNPPKEFDVFANDGSGAYSESVYDNPGVNKSRSIREEIGKYDGEILYVDYNIGRIMQALSELGLEDNTVVVITSDHGECFGEHRFSDFGYDSKRIYLLHGKTLFDEEMRVPLIIMNPKSSIRGLRLSGLSESVDIMPTVMHILGINNSLSLDGRSLVPLIEGLDSGKNTVFMQVFNRKGMDIFGIRDYRWKLVRMCKKEDCVPQEMLFDTDSGEKEDISDRPDIKERLGNELEQALNSSVDDEIKKSLEMIGYLG